MADPRTNLKVSIGAELGEIKSALATLRGDLKQTQKAASGVDFKGITSGLKGLLGAIGGIGAVTLGIRAIANATIEAEKAQAQLNAVLKSTGGVAGVTAKAANDLAESLQKVSTFSDEEILGAESLLLTFTKVGKDVFPQATKAILDMSIAMGQDLKSSTVQVGKALNDPIAGITALTRVGVSFSDGQKAVIKDLVETGRVAEAQTLILKELQTEFGGSAEAARNTLGGALQGLKNDFDNVLEGDTGTAGARGMVDAINELAAVMRSPETKASFASLVSGITSVGTAFATATAAIIEYIQYDAKRLAEATSGTGGAAGDIPYIEKRLAGLRADEANFLTRDFTGGDARKIKEFEALLQEAKAAQQRALAAEITANISDPRAPGKSTATGSKTGSGSGGKSAAARAADARIAEEKRAAEEVRKIEEAEEKDRIARNERIAEGMADVKIKLLRENGEVVAAAFAEIDARYADLLADLRLKGDAEGESTLMKLIGLEKADAELKAFDAEVQRVLENLRQQTEFINNARQVPGGITPLQAEEQMRALRAQSIQQLTVLREKAMAAYNAAPTAETLARVNQLDGAIKELDDSFTTLLANTAQDEGVAALSGFFTDLALGAKSFKDAFKDMVRNFVSGIATMVAQQLALNAVKAITAGFGSFHTGGIAGNRSGATRSVNPAVFAAAPRYHSGGVAGLRANEVPAILLKGERVLSPSQTAAYNKGDRPSPGTRIVNVFDPNFVPDQMDSAAGEKVILNVIGRNPGRVQAMLR